MIAIAHKLGLKYILGWLIAGTRGGITRARIIKTLKDSPCNANQLSSNLNLDYRTVRHHLDILSKNKLVTVVGEGYGQAYFVHPLLEENYGLFEQISNRIWEKEKRKKKN